MFPKDVHLVFDRFTRPQKLKRVICVCAEQRLFLRINSKPLWPPQHLICAVNCDFLDHDSYVELQNLVRYSEEDIAASERIGRLTARVAAELMRAVEKSKALNQRHKDLIRDRWGF